MTAGTPLAMQQALLEERFPPFMVTLPSGARVMMRQRGQRGAGPSLVLLHGISSGAASWLPAVLQLPADLHVIAWDAPGYGHSTPLAPSAPRAEDYAGRLHELLQGLGIQRCVLAGHSLGALMACAFAAQHSAFVERLVLISPARGYGASVEDAARVRQQRRSALETAGVAGLAARIDQRLLSAQATPEQREWVRWNTARLNPAGYLQAVEMLTNSVLADVQVPVQVHCGSEDVVTTPASCEQAARALGTTCLPIAGAGHASPIEQPAAVSALLRAATEQRHG